MYSAGATLKFSLTDLWSALYSVRTRWVSISDCILVCSKQRMWLLQAASSGRLPKLLVLITGKGPQKEFYLGNLRTLSLRHVAFRTLWLASEDYPILLASADLGISLHYSSSGLDLPMKVPPPSFLFPIQYNRFKLPRRQAKGLGLKLEQETLCYLSRYHLRGESFKSLSSVVVWRRPFSGCRFPSQSAPFGRKGPQ